MQTAALVAIAARTSHMRLSVVEDDATVAAMPDDAPDEIVFEGKEADAFVEALKRGTASAEYLCEADELFARIYSPEPINRLFQHPAGG
jgi:hypothetical protein